MGNSIENINAPPPTLSDLTAVLLVGGLGTRLRSVVADKPKVLAEINQRPFLSYLLDQLVAAGVKDVILCTGYLGEQIQQTYGASYRGLRLIYSQEQTPSGTGGALRLVLPWLTSDSLLVMNGDSFCRADLAAFYRWFLARQADVALTLVDVPDTSRYGRVRLDDDGRVQAFEEKGQAGPGWINAGIYLIRRALLETIPANTAVSLEHAMFPAWRAYHFYGYPTHGQFLDIGTPESYAAAAQFFKDMSV